MVGEAVQQSPGQAFRAEYLRPLIERQVGGHQDRAPLVALAEDFEQQPSAQALPSKVNHLVLKAGDSMRLETAGGGGYGPPRERSLDLLAADIRSGVMSRKAAERGYGVAMVRRALGEAKPRRATAGRRPATA